MAVPHPQQWSLARLQEVDVTPWSKFEGTLPAVVPHVPLPDEVAPARESVAKRLYIRQRDLEQHGYTANCPKCDHITQYGNGKESQNYNHSEACRRRLLDEIAKSEEGQRRIAQAELRAQRSIAEHLERVEGPRPPAAAQGEIAAPAPAAAEYEPRHEAPQKLLPMPGPVNRARVSAIRQVGKMHRKRRTTSETRS